MLVMAMSAVFAWNVRSFLCLVGDWELQRQVQRVMQYVVLDLQYASSYTLSGNVLTITKPDEKITYRPRENSKSVIYRVTGKKSTQPINGDTSMCTFESLALTCTPIDAATLAVRCKGVNRQTRHSYELQTAVTLYNAAGGA